MPDYYLSSEVANLMTLKLIGKILDSKGKEVKKEAASAPTQNHEPAAVGNHQPV